MVHLLPAAALFWFLLHCSHVLGQGGVSITPTRIPLSLAAGDPAIVEVTLINGSEEPLRLRPQVLELLDGEEPGPGLSASERCLWVEPESGELSLAPRASQTFTFRVRPAPEAAPGTYRFALAFIPVLEKTGGIAFTGGLASLLELEVLPTPPRAGISFVILLPAFSAVVLALLLAALTIRRARRRNGVEEVEVLREREP